MSTEIFRVDKFVVSAHAREEFLDKVHAWLAVLKTQTGFVRDAILEQASGLGEFNFVSIVEWENSDAMEGARRPVVTLHQKMNFDAQAGSEFAPTWPITIASNERCLLNNEELYENANENTLRGAAGCQVGRNQWPEEIVAKFLAAELCAK